MVTVLQGLHEIYRSLWLHAINSSAHPSYWFCRTLWPWFISVQPTEPSQYHILQIALYRLQTLLTLSVYLFTAKHLHLLQLTGYVHKLQFRVYKSRKELKPARILYYGTQTDAYLVFFLTSPILRFQVIPPFFFILSFILIHIVFVLPFPNALFHWRISFLYKYLKFFFLVIPNCQSFYPSHLTFWHRSFTFKF
jgi:hypothetical protein